MRSLVTLSLLAILGLALSGAAGEMRHAGSYADADTIGTRHYRLLPASALWIEGTTPVSGFTCRAEGAAGRGAARAHPLYDPAEQVRLDAALAVPVRSFDCGQDRMNRDLADALRAEAHPRIELRLTGVSFGSDRASEAASEAGEDWQRVEAWGVLSLGGEEQPVRLRGEAKRTGAHLRARGSYPMRMSDFGVEPPSGPLGLIRARDDVLIHFDLYLVPYAPRGPDR
jgi:polyisoprenoid-binding protein YceI